MSGVVRARDLRTNIKELGFERGITVTVELLLEEMVAFRQLVHGTADVQGMMADVLQDLVQVSDTLKNRIEQMQRIREGDSSG